MPKDPRAEARLILCEYLNCITENYGAAVIDVNDIEFAQTFLYNKGLEAAVSGTAIIYAVGKVEPKEPLSKTEDKSQTDTNKD